MADIAGTLGTKYGPLPGWAWLGGSVVLAVVVVRRRRRATPPAAADAQSAPAEAGSGDPATSYAQGFGDGYDYSGAIAGSTQSQTAPTTTSTKPPAAKKRPPHKAAHRPRPTRRPYPARAPRRHRRRLSASGTPVTVPEHPAAVIA